MKCAHRRDVIREMREVIRKATDAEKLRQAIRTVQMHTISINTLDGTILDSVAAYAVADALEEEALNSPIYTAAEILAKRRIEYEEGR